jgi:hypothetical protein
MQHFITRTGVEGIVTSAITAIARSLTQPEFDLGPTLQLFVRDEVGDPDLGQSWVALTRVQLLTWINTYMKEPRHETLTKSVYLNVDHFIRRASTMGYIGENKDKVGRHLWLNSLDEANWCHRPPTLLRSSTPSSRSCRKRRPRLCSPKPTSCSCRGTKCSARSCYRVFPPP